MARSRSAAIVGAGLVSLAVAIGLSGAAARAGEPAVFSKVSYADAIKASEADKKYLIVKGTAVWCGPCKQMDKTTWVDERVVQWVKDHGTAISLDVDKHPNTARNLKINAMPTMVLFKDGKEIDRVVGYRSADQLLKWMNDAKAGKTTKKEMDDKLAGLKAGNKTMSVDERMELANSLRDQEKFEAAAEQYEWLWKNMVTQQPSMLGVRGSFLASDIERLCEQHEPSKKRFAAIRDEVEARLKGENKTWDDLNDWLVLNKIVSDDQRTLAWVDRIKGDDEGKKTLARLAYRVDDLLEKHERWADLGAITREPIRKLEEEHSFIKMSTGRSLPASMSDDDRKQMEAYAWQRFRDKAGMIHASLLAAGREDDAKAVAARAAALDPSDDMQKALTDWQKKIKAK